MWFIHHHGHGHDSSLCRAATSTVKIYLYPHCNRELGKTAFFRHKRLYFDKSKKQWLKESSTVKMQNDPIMNRDKEDFSPVEPEKSQENYESTKK